MKKKIKLRDMTEEQYVDWRTKNCRIIKKCSDCPFSCCRCSNGERIWVGHKEMFSDKFLDQEVEIEVPDILTPEEKEYLKAVIAPFRQEAKNLIKISDIKPNGYWVEVTNDIKGYRFCACVHSNQSLRFEGLEEGHFYTLEDLGL